MDIWTPHNEVIENWPTPIFENHHSPENHSWLISETPTPGFVPILQDFYYTDGLPQAKFEYVAMFDHIQMKEILWTVEISDVKQEGFQPFMTNMYNKNGMTYIEQKYYKPEPNQNSVSSIFS